MIDGAVDRASEGFRIYRFGDVAEEVAGADRFDDLFDFIRAGDQQAEDPGEATLHDSYELRAVQLRHKGIGNQDVDRLLFQGL